VSGISEAGATRYGGGYDEGDDDGFDAGYGHGGGRRVAAPAYAADDHDDYFAMIAETHPQTLSRAAVGGGGRPSLDAGGPPQLLAAGATRADMRSSTSGGGVGAQQRRAGRGASTGAGTYGDDRGHVYDATSVLAPFAGAPAAAAYVGASAPAVSASGGGGGAVVDSFPSALRQAGGRWSGVPSTLQPAASAAVATASELPSPRTPPLPPSTGETWTISVPSPQAHLAAPIAATAAAAAANMALGLPAGGFFDRGGIGGGSRAPGAITRAAMAAATGTGTGGADGHDADVADRADELALDLFRRLAELARPQV